MDDRSIAREMRPNRHPLDEVSAARLLQGAVHPDDAPPGYGLVAGLLATAATPAIDEDAGATTIAAMVEAIRNTAPIPEPTRRKSMLGKIFAGKALVAVATVALTASGAAAATGTLPTPVQGAVADAVSHIGIDLPDHHGSKGRAADDPADDDAKDAKDAKDDKDDKGAPTSTTAKAKAKDADSAGGHDTPNKGQIISGITHDPALDGQPKGPTVCAEASSDRCRAGEDHGKDGVGSGTTSTTETTSSTTSPTTLDRGGSRPEDPGNSGSSGSGKASSGKGGSGKGRSGGSDDD